MRGRGYCDGGVDCAGRNNSNERKSEKIPLFFTEATAIETRILFVCFYSKTDYGDNVYVLVFV